MAEYTVRETVTLLHFVEADNEADAIWRAKERGVREFDEVDCSPEGASGPMTAKLSAA